MGDDPIHLAIDGTYNDCSRSRLRAWLEAMPEKIGMTPISTPFVREHKGSLMGFIFLAESHISVHFYPDHTAYVDLYSCDYFCPVTACKEVTNGLKIQVKSTPDVGKRGLEFLGG